MNSIFWHGNWITRDMFEARVTNFAGFLQAIGVQIGERVALLAQNHPIHLEAIYAAFRYGFIHAPLNYRLPPLELAPLVKYIEPSVLIYAVEFEAQALEASRQLPDLRLVRLEEIEEHNHFVGVQLNSPLQPPLNALPEILMLLFTGGTTGLPKAAQVTREMFLTNVTDTISSWGLSAFDCSVIATPMFHAGVNALATPLLEVGGRVAILEKFSPEAYLAMVQESGSTHLFAVPTMFQMLIESTAFADFDFSNIKYAITGGSPCPSHVRQAFLEKGVQFKLGYGMTEAGVNCFTQNLEQAMQKPSSVGYPMPNLKAVLRDEHGKPAQTGELTLSGKQIMSGYWNKPLETAEALRQIDGQTWLFTGDLAECDSDGHYSIIGRSKDMIISGGENIYPLEIERAIYEHPGILECAVLGVPDVQWGEVALAAMVTRTRLSSEELRQFLRSRLANYKVPKHYVFVEELPKSAAGKILKHILRQHFMTHRKPGQLDGRSASQGRLGLTSAQNLSQPKQLVLLHGNYASARWWQPYLEIRLDGWARIAPTYPGFAGTPALEATNIGTLCDWLEAQWQPFVQPVLLGHSLGGVLALELAARHPNRYSGLILVCSPSLMGFPHNPAGDPVRAQIPHNRALLEQLFTMQSPSLSNRAGALWEGILDDAQTLPFEIGNGFAVHLDAWNRLEAAQNLAQIPTLILAGEADVLIGQDISLELKKQLPHAALEIRPHIGHWLPLEDEVGFAARVQQFLEAL